MAKNEVIELLRQYILVLRAEGVKVEKAYLYGSYLHNTANEDSDIDVLIVSENDDDFTVGKAWSLTMKVSTKIEPYLVGKARFYANDGTPLIDQIKSYGFEIC